MKIWSLTWCKFFTAFRKLTRLNCKKWKELKTKSCKGALFTETAKKWEKTCLSGKTSLQFSNKTTSISTKHPIHLPPMKKFASKLPKSNKTMMKILYFSKIKTNKPPKSNSMTLSNLSRGTPLSKTESTTTKNFRTLT